MTMDVVPPAVERSMSESTDGEVAVQPPVDNPGAVYKIVGASKIPVSKKLGMLWKARKDQAETAWKLLFDRNREAIRYYNNDQAGHRTERDGASGNTMFARRINDKQTETENLVFSNTNTLVTLLYSKNPKPEITASREEDKKLAAVSERLVYTLANQEAAPGINLKPKVKQAVVLASLTNCAWIETAWIPRQESSEQAFADLQQASDELTSAKDEKEIRAAEGKLMALEEKVNFLNPAGLLVRLRAPFDVLVDPCSMEPDNSDATWIMVYDYIPTGYLNAVYGQKEEGSDIVKSIYEPTHILMGSSGQQAQEQVNTFRLFDSSASEPKAYGYADPAQLKDAERTKVCYIWDKITRRVLMYSDKKWDWPIWVWDDPYKFPRFYPFRKLYYHTAPIGCQAQGEVSYYLDQQDAVNEINDEFRRARLWAKTNLVYDKKRVSPDDVAAILTGSGPTATGVDVPEGMKVDDMVKSIIPPALRDHKELFDKQDKYQAIDRTASVNELMRGGQLKTNTTNKAIDYYSASQNTKLDDKLDSIEDFIGGIFSDILFLCMQYMTQQEVVALLGENEQGAWRQETPENIRRNFPCRVVGGSTQKPTSAAKKQEAIQVGQALGQFANSAPISVLQIALKLFEQAFDEINITDLDWQKMQQEAMAQMQRGNSVQGAAPGGQSASPPAQQGGDSGGASPIIQALQGVVAAIQKGVPPAQAVQEALNLLTPQRG